MRVVIETIPHKEQRYDTCGDWLFDGDTLKIFVSKTKDWRYSFLVAVHELIEVGLCKQAGITQQAVDKFDMNFKGKGEPGDDPKAPYRIQHAVATAIERDVALELDVDWQKYEAALNKL
jgi:hypothetical protein